MLNITIEVVSNKDLVLQIVKFCSPSLPPYNSVDVEQISSTSNSKCIYLGNKRCFTSLPNRILIVCWMFINYVTNTFPWINVLSLHFPFKILLRPVKWTPDKAINQAKVFRYLRKDNLLYFKLLQFTLLAQNNDLAASDNCLSNGFGGRSWVL